MRFASRQDAGRQLADFLRRRGVSINVILGLPRGGIVVAAEIARELKLPLDVLIVRKIGHPLQREFAVGAIAEPEVLILDESFLSGISANRSELEKVIAEETAQLRERRARFRGSAAPALTNQSVLLVDDGLATGATAEAAVLSARKQNARRVIVAVPVASMSAFKKVERSADEVVALAIDPDFQSVGQYYENFDQTTDDEVVALLNNHLLRSE